MTGLSREADAVSRLRTITGPIREVTQTITVPNDDDVPGNCVQAAVASLLNLPLAAVPHFVLFDQWREAMCLWLSQFDLNLESEPTAQWPHDLAIVAGTSPRGLGHVVLAEHGRLLWDPHPDRSGLVTVDEVWRIRWVG